MTQEVLKMALDWAEAHGEIVFAGGGMSAVNKMNSWVAAIKEALAKEKTLQALHSENERLGLYKDAYAQLEQDIAALVTGMEVSIDVSTGDHDSGNRLFGGVTLVQECLGTKHGLILLVQKPEANFKEKQAWVGLTDEEFDDLRDNNFGVSPLISAVEAKLKEKNSA